MALPNVAEGDPHPKAHNDERAAINALQTAVAGIPAGVDGKSAYQIWLDAGNAGTQAQFLASLKGTDGEDGVDGEDGLALPVDHSMPDAASPPGIVLRQPNTVTDTDSEMLQVFYKELKTLWLCEWGGLRTEAGKPDQVAQKTFGWRGAGNHLVDIHQWYSKAGLVVSFGPDGRPRVGPAQVPGAWTVPLAVGAPRTDVPANTLIARF